MRLVCGSQEWLGKYEQLCSDRALGFSVWPSRMSLLVAEGKELVAGVMIYDTTGPFLFFEHLVTNETASLRARHRAVTLMAEEMLSMCRHLGKLPQIMVRHAGIRKILERVGLSAPGAYVMTCAFYQLESHEHHESPKSTRPNPHGPDHPDSEPNRASSRPAAGRNAEISAGVPAPVA